MRDRATEAGVWPLTLLCDTIELLSRRVADLEAERDEMQRDLTSLRDLLDRAITAAIRRHRDTEHHAEWQR